MVERVEGGQGSGKHDPETRGSVVPWETAGGQREGGGDDFAVSDLSEL